jgi:hypothetical protein
MEGGLLTLDNAHRPVVMERLALFAYGSLVRPESASRTLGRPVEIAARARLAGWRRRWSACRDNRAVEKTFSRPDGSVPDFCLGLNLEAVADNAGGPNGALLELSTGELDRLDLREMRYDRLEVTEQVAAAGDLGLDHVFAYTVKPGHLAPAPPTGAVIIAPYLRAVEAAFAALGPGELELFHETTPRPPVELIEAVLVRDLIPPGNPREW